MSYVSILDVEAFTGYGAADMKQGGLTMTASQWEDYCENDLIPRIEQMVHRYCGVTSFDEHVVIEFRNSEGDDEFLDQYLGWMTPGGPALTTRQMYEYTLVEPCISVSSVAIKPNQWVASWEDMIEVGSTGGDYYTETQDEITHVYLNRVPAKGGANIRITYNAGYPTDSPQFQEIQMAILRIIRINLEEKLKFQQAGTFRNVNTKDYMEMYDINKNAHKEQFYIPADITHELNRYRRLFFSQGI